jgi:uncharacterized membrane protein
MFYALLFLLGGIIYVSLEYFWRGRSHVSVFLASGLACVLLYGVFAQFNELSTLAKSLMGALIITALEFITGAIVNVRLGLGVWDYSAHRYNLYGQICLEYSALWVLLSTPITLLPAFVATL